MVVSGVLQCSVPVSPVDDDELAFDFTPSITLAPSQYRFGARALVVAGSSMDDGGPKAIRAGDIVLASPHDYVYSGRNRVAVFETPNGYVGKRRGLVGGKLALLSDHPDVEPILDLEGFKYIGVVYAIYQGPKRVIWL